MNPRTEFPLPVTVAEAQAWLDRFDLPRVFETVSLSSAAGRVLAETIHAPCDVPAFRRAMMDGFALRSVDVAAASPLHPVSLPVAGRLLPGDAREVSFVPPGSVFRVMTGAPLPHELDAVLPFEQVLAGGGVGERAGGATAALPANIKVDAPLAPGRHVGAIGEDVRAGEAVLCAGRFLRPQDVGLLASLGLASVNVVGRVRVAIFSTGNELVPLGTPRNAAQIVDSNGPMLASLVARDEGLVQVASIVADRPDVVRQALEQDADVTLLSGGSSAGDEDFAPRCLQLLGKIEVRRVRMRPGGPVVLGHIGRRLVAILPGNPVACLCTYDCFPGRFLRRAAGKSGPWPYVLLASVVGAPIHSQLGRWDYARVVVREGRVFPLETSGASRLSSTVKADGFVVVPESVEWLAVGQAVEVFCYDA